MKAIAPILLGAGLLAACAHARPTAPAPVIPSLTPIVRDQVRTYGSPTSPFASTVTVPAGYDTIYVAGRTAAPVTPAVPATPTTPAVAAVYGNTEQQTEAIITRIEADLRDQGATLGDVVSMVVYLVGVPTNEGRLDFAGMNAAYARHFGTAAQPNRPVRTTVQVAGLAGPGLLAEITVVAVRPPRPAARPAS